MDHEIEPNWLRKHDFGAYQFHPRRYLMGAGGENPAVAGIRTREAVLGKLNRPD